MVESMSSSRARWPLSTPPHQPFSTAMVSTSHRSKASSTPSSKADCGSAFHCACCASTVEEGGEVEAETLVAGEGEEVEEEEEEDMAAVNAEVVEWPSVSE